jgi:hypothetical protein
VVADGWKDVDRRDPAQQGEVPDRERHVDPALGHQLAAREAWRDEGDGGEGDVAEPAIRNGVDEGRLRPVSVQLEGQVEDTERQAEAEIGQQPEANREKADARRHRQPDRRGHAEPDGRRAGRAGNQAATPSRRLVIRTQLLGVHRHVEADTLLRVA